MEYWPQTSNIFLLATVISLICIQRIEKFCPYYWPGLIWPYNSSQKICPLSSISFWLFLRFIALDGNKTTPFYFCVCIPMACTLCGWWRSVGAAVLAPPGSSSATRYVHSTECNEGECMQEGAMCLGWNEKTGHQQAEASIQFTSWLCLVVTCCRSLSLAAHWYRLLCRRMLIWNSPVRCDWRKKSQGNANCMKMPDLNMMGLNRHWAVLLQMVFYAQLCTMQSLTAHFYTVLSCTLRPFSLKCRPGFPYGHCRWKC